MTISIARLFIPGKIVVTASLAKHRASLKPYLNRHLKGDWGNLNKEDRQSNDLAVKAGDLRIFSAYEIGFATDADIVGTIWIITEADRSATTILRPGEY